MKLAPTEVNKFNSEQLKLNGVNTFAHPAYKTVRSIGDLKKARLWDGTEVERKDILWVNNEFVKCAQYELHFVHETPVSMPGWGLYCTCGSIAVVVGYKEYAKLASPSDTGKLIVCLRHTTTKQNTGIGEHADGSHE